MIAVSDRRPGDTEQLGNLGDGEPLVVVFGATVNALVLPGWPVGLGVPLGSTTLSQCLYLFTVKGGPALTSGGRVAFADELGHVAHTWQPRIAAASS